MYIPVVLFFAKKSEVDILSSFSIPSVVSFISIVLIGASLRYIITVPLDQPGLFFKSLFNSKLRFLTFTYENSILDIFMIVALVIPEEIIFRGVILKQFLKQYSPKKAIILSSVIFTLVHVTTIKNYFAALFISGIIFGVLYYRSESVLVTSVVHIIFNWFDKHSWAYIDLTLTDTIGYIILYLIVIFVLVYLLRKPIKTYSINHLVENFQSVFRN